MSYSVFFLISHASHMNVCNCRTYLTRISHVGYAIRIGFEMLLLYESEDDIFCSIFLLVVKVFCTQTQSRKSAR